MISKRSEASGKRERLWRYNVHIYGRSRELGNDIRFEIPGSIEELKEGSL
jgi:hypothetical protein